MKESRTMIGIMIVFLLVGGILGCGLSSQQLSNEAGEETEQVTEQITTEGEQDTGTQESAEAEDEVKAATVDSTEKELVSQEVVEPRTNYLTDELMSDADYWAGSDESAIAAVMKKAQAGEKVTIAVIGGSITEGTISNGTKDSEVGEKKAYADIFFDWWSETYPDTEFEFINAGIGATNSYLGVHRVQSDVLDSNPDLVLVEFSVNDGNTIFFERSYDNLVRKILLSDGNPAVLLLFMSQTNDSSSQDNDSLIGFRYSIPMVSFKNVMDDLMESGTYTAEELSGDNVHPSALGHAITGEILWRYLNSIYEVVDTYQEPESFDCEPVTKDCYLDSEIMDSTSITPDDLGTFEAGKALNRFPNDWICKEGDGEITFTITCRNLGVMYKCQTDGNGGQFEVYVDGENAATLDADFTDGWGDYAETTECYTSKEAAEHTIVIKKAADSTGDEFSILGLLVSR